MKPCVVWAPEILVVDPAALLAAGWLLIIAGLSVAAASV
jgi:hypothetical protein